VFRGAAIRPEVCIGVRFAHWGMCGCYMPSLSEAKVRSAKPRERACYLANRAVMTVEAVAMTTLRVLQEKGKRRYRAFFPQKLHILFR